jgi:hypothetical protein
MRLTGWPSFACGGMVVNAMFCLNPTTRRNNEKYTKAGGGNVRTLSLTKKTTRASAKIVRSYVIKNL